MIKHLLFSVAVVSVLALAIPAHAQIFIDFDFPPGQALGSRGSGQTFTPADAVGADGAKTLNLSSVRLWRGNGGIAATQVSPTSFMVIYDGDPDGGATQVGASSNSIDIAIGDPNGTQYDWSFSDLTLEASTTYWAVFSNSPVDDNILQDQGGTGLEMSVQTVDEDYAGGISLIAGRTPHNNGMRDLRFVAGFEKPGDILLGDVNCDGFVDLLDVAPFVALLTDGGFSPKADFDFDGEVTLLDIDGFINALGP